MKFRFNETKKSRFLKQITRRDLLKGSGLAALTGVAGCQKTDSTEKIRIPIPTYESIGVKPIINCWGTLTRLSGSLTLPEVKLAMTEAGKHYVPVDELMEGVGRRLAELTGAEWGMITCGCAAALAGSTAACIAGTDLEKMALLPDTRGMKNEVVVASNHRNTYDRAIWMVGAKRIEVESNKDAMEAAINEKTALITCFGSGFDRDGITLEEVVSIGKKHGIPTLVDAAAERLFSPDFYIKAGIDLVAYSGGKALRGPQSSGMLLGRKDLVHAAFMNLAPHHSYGRPMKAGKEDVMGLLTAVDLWFNGRDHDAEWKEWERRLAYIGEKVSEIPSVKTDIVQPKRRADKYPTLSIDWDQNTVKLNPDEARSQLARGNPRIALYSRSTGIGISPWMMEESEEIIVAQRISEVLSSAV
ncbi:MAG: aminotransferase class V-fold PLP-dependent enzyme [Candidatus Latescibacteria bacterium]|nr:aminotransferase class V-fold PLP-dependent enzyme [Candidatus Latescibacterota bacterium]